tara:strand:- start:16490 stop:16993 length:504 start_codon:yes stop_codon:yes gene_type:complete
MKNYILLFLLGISITGYCQDLSYNTCKIYYNSLKHIGVKNKQPILLKYDFEVSDSLKNTLLKSGIINFKSYQKNKSSLPIKNSFKCKKVAKELSKMNLITNIHNFEEYDLLNYSYPIYINRNNAILFFEYLHIQKGKGIKGGATMIQEYERKKNSWLLVTTKILESY